jgi:hypothetical protein
MFTPQGLGTLQRIGKYNEVFTAFLNEADIGKEIGGCPLPNNLW